MVHVVASVHLGGAPVTTPVMRNDAIAIGQKEQHLHVPVVGAKRPTVVKHDRLCILWAPVFVEDIDSVFGSNRWHEEFSLVFW
jgi:hypothetical protein